MYLTGTTRSTDFPTTVGADGALDGSADVFVTKLSPGGAVLYSTYLGGPCEDYGRAIAVDAAGNAYVTGEVNGGGTCVSDPGVLVAKLDADGRLVYASPLGGSLLDASYGTGIAVDAEGHAYVTGVALTSDFPTTPGAYRTAPCPNVLPFAGDGFVAELTVDGSALVYSTLLCGQGDDAPSGFAIDAAGNRVRRGDDGVERLPARPPDRALARRRCRRAERLRLEAEPGRHAATRRRRRSSARRWTRRSRIRSGRSTSR